MMIQVVGEWKGTEGTSDDCEVTGVTENNVGKT